MSARGDGDITGSKRSASSTATATAAATATTADAEPAVKRANLNVNDGAQLRLFQNQQQMRRIAELNSELRACAARARAFEHREKHLDATLAVVNDAWSELLALLGAAASTLGDNDDATQRALAAFPTLHADTRTPNDLKRSTSLASLLAERAAGDAAAVKTEPTGESKDIKGKGKGKAKAKAGAAVAAAAAAGKKKGKRASSDEDDLYIETQLRAAFKERVHATDALLARLLKHVEAENARTVDVARLLRGDGDGDGAGDGAAAMTDGDSGAEGDAKLAALAKENERLCARLERVTAENAALAMRAKDDAAALTESEAAKWSLASDVDDLRDTVAELRDTVVYRDRRVAQLTAELKAASAAAGGGGGGGTPLASPAASVGAAAEGGGGGGGEGDTAAAAGAVRDESEWQQLQAAVTDLRAQVADLKEVSQIRAREVSDATNREAATAKRLREAEEKLGRAGAGGGAGGGGYATSGDAAKRYRELEVEHAQLQHAYDAMKAECETLQYDARVAESEKEVLLQRIDVRFEERERSIEERMRVAAVRNVTLERELAAAQHALEVARLAAQSQSRVELGKLLESARQHAQSLQAEVSTLRTSLARTREEVRTVQRDAIADPQLARSGGGGGSSSGSGSRRDERRDDRRGDDWRDSGRRSSGGGARGGVGEEERDALLAREYAAQESAVRLSEAEAELATLKNERATWAAKQKDLQALVDAFQPKSAERRELGQLVAAERRLKASLAERDARVAELEAVAAEFEAYKVKLRETPRGAQVDDAMRLQRTEAAYKARMVLARRGVARMEAVVAEAQGESDGLMGEIEQLSEAFEELQEQNARVIATVAEKEDTNIRLMSEALKQGKLDAMHRTERRALEDALAAAKRQIDNLTALHTRDKSVNAQRGTEVAAIVEEKKTLQAVADRHLTLNREYAQRVEALQRQHETADTRLRTVAAQLEEAKKASEDAKRNARRLGEDYVVAQRQLQRFEKREGARTGDTSSVDALELELENMKELMNCSICGERVKECVLRKCNHTFCRDCIDHRTKIRMRKLGDSARNTSP